MLPPVFDIDPDEFHRDPYPAYQRMRNEAPICFVPQLGAVLLTKRDDIFVCEKNIEVFSSHQPDGLMTVLMGENMMRKDGENHLRERKAIFPTVSPKTVAQHWKKRFESVADAVLDEFEKGEEIDLVQDYAMRLSAESLKLITGLESVRWQDMDSWSQAMIDGIANYAGNPEVEARCRAATSAIDQAITDHLANPATIGKYSLLATLRDSGLGENALFANIRLAISGGQNEQRDAIAGCVWALLTHRGQLNEVVGGEKSWSAVFEEYCRWISPIGMSPRRIARPHTYCGIEFVPEQRAFLMFASANRDEACFDKPDLFEVGRNTSKAIAFGAGPHFCAGAWASRCLVSEVALPKLFQRFANLELADLKANTFAGWAFRGLRRLPVVLH